MVSFINCNFYFLLIISYYQGDIDMNNYSFYSDFEEGKVIIALNKNFNANVNEIFNEIDIEKIEVIFNTSKTNFDTNIGDIVLVYLKKKKKKEGKLGRNCYKGLLL